jgi:nitroimidazol reductase NimA-like FMN-containing flavoprotein (pyridoxamine 5'-phosphate oxidase superfamily)
MRRKDQEITDKELLESILANAEVCRLGLSLNDMPYVVPVNFGYKDGCLYIHSSPAGRKMEIISQNNKVCFELEWKVELVQADAPCDWSCRYYSIIGFGRAYPVTECDEKVTGLTAIMEHYSSASPFVFPESKVTRTAVIRVEIDSMTGKKAKY